jgi:hypothetical protein
VGTAQRGRPHGPHGSGGVAKGRGEATPWVPRRRADCRESSRADPRHGPVDCASMDAMRRCDSTASWTWPATASILTGLTPMEHGLTGERSSFRLEHARTQPEALQLADSRPWPGAPIRSPRRAATSTGASSVSTAPSSATSRRAPSASRESREQREELVPVLPEEAPEQANARTWTRNPLRESRSKRQRANTRSSSGSRFAK